MATRGQQYQPTDKDRNLVKTLSGIGLPQHDICAILNITKPTLHKFYRVEIDLGLAEANAKIAKTLFDMATGGNVGAAIFWAKARMGWREKHYDDIPSEEADFGKKEMRKRDARDAGKDTEWGDDLRPPAESMN
jgi:hypothetical protein